MIQRIQSIFLVLVLGIFITLFFIPVYIVPVKAPAIDAQLNGMMQFIPLLFIPMAALAIVALIAIFSYKNRKRQMKICRAGAVLAILISLNALVFPQFFMHGIDRTALQFGVGAYLLPVTIILFALAANSIRKDEELVRAADRLR